MTRITLVSPFAYARPIANFKLEPEAQCFLGIFPEASQIGSSKPRKKKAYPKLRSSTIAPDSVEALQVWRRSNGHGSHNPPPLFEIQARSEQCEPKVQGMSHEGTLLPKGATNPLTQ